MIRHRFFRFVFQNGPNTHGIGHPPSECLFGRGYDQDWRELAYIGEILENMTGFLTFYEVRRDRMKKRLAEILGVSLGEGTKVAAQADRSW